MPMPVKPKWMSLNNLAGDSVNLTPVGLVDLEKDYPSLRVKYNQYADTMITGLFKSDEKAMLLMGVYVPGNLIETKCKYLRVMDYHISPSLEEIQIYFDAVNDDAETKMVEKAQDIVKEQDKGVAKPVQMGIVGNDKKLLMLEPVGEIDLLSQNPSIRVKSEPAVKNLVTALHQSGDLCFLVAGLDLGEGTIRMFYFHATILDWIGTSHEDDDWGSLSIFLNVVYSNDKEEHGVSFIEALEKEEFNFIVPKEKLMGLKDTVQESNKILEKWEGLVKMPVKDELLLDYGNFKGHADEVIKGVVDKAAKEAAKKIFEKGDESPTIKPLTGTYIPTIRE